jgi:hypothetical protein
VSSPQHPVRPFEVRGQTVCMCTHGGSCSAFSPGHALHLVQARLVASTPSEWVDAIVCTVDDTTGEIVLRALADGAPVTVWSAAGAAGTAKVGEPVALHPRYHALSSGGRLFNVAVLD